LPRTPIHSPDAAPNLRLRTLGDPEQANSYYAVAERLGTPVEASYAHSQRQEIAILDEIGLLDGADG
jgi:hypothetical protein